MIATKRETLARYRDALQRAAELEDRLHFTRAAQVARAALQTVFDELYSRHPKERVTRHAVRIHELLLRVKAEELGQ